MLKKNPSICSQVIIWKRTTEGLDIWIHTLYNCIPHNIRSLCMEGYKKMMAVFKGKCLTHRHESLFFVFFFSFSVSIMLHPCYIVVMDDYGVVTKQT